MSEIYDIGPWVLDAHACVLMRDGAPVPLGKRAVALLTALVRSAPDYVPKARLLEEAWPGVIVEEGNLAVQILAIRRALAGVPGGDGWLQTLARRGYRFTGPVSRRSVGATSASAATPRSSTLPEPFTSFIGRDREVSELLQLLSGTRLLTLTGTGGVGKTRLALRVANAAHARYRDGACLVELAALHDPELVPGAMMNALALAEQPGTPLARTLVEHLRARELLIVLDNAEHLLSASARLVDAVLRECGDIAIIVTSRERLGVPGEVTYRVPSLSLPAIEGGEAPHAIGDCESVRLFVERVRLHRPHFTLAGDDARAVANICRRLDGIALAIELAAARTRSMSIDDIDRRLDQRLALLADASRTLPLRQQTLRAAIDWSYDLLSDAERTLFAALSVFAGGFALDAAEHVCAGGTIGAQDVLDLVASLADKSLVVVDERGTSTRYRMLETVQQYAAQRLRASADEKRWYERHCTHFLALAEAAEPQLTGAEQRAWLDRLEREHDNLRAALTRSSMLDPVGERGLGLASALGRFWLVRGYLAEGRGWFSKLLACAGDANRGVRARALNWAGIFAWKQGDYAAANSLYEQSIAIRRELGDRKGIGAVLNNQGLLAYEQGDFRGARALHEQSLAIDRELGDRWGIAVSLIHLASLAEMQGDYTAARTLVEESLAIFREFDDRAHVANAIRSLARLHGQLGDDAAARELYDESLSMCRELGDRSGIAGALHGLGVTARRAGDHAQARALLDDSLRMYREVGDREATAKALNSLGQLAAAGGDESESARLHRESLAIYRELRDRCGIAASLEGVAAAVHARRDARCAARLWGATARLRDAIGAPLAPSERRDRDRHVADARASLGDAFDVAWREGERMELDQAIALALESDR